MAATHQELVATARPAVQTPSAHGPAIAFVAAGFLFVLYPAIRPFSDETSLQGAAAFASNSWLTAHTMGMTAFVLMALGLLGLHTRPQATASTQRSLKAVIVSWVGVSLTLVFYGAETFGLAAIGQAALERDDVSLIALADTIRLGPGIGFLTVGLAVLATGAGMFARIIWRTGVQHRRSGIPLAVGLVLYLPQFVAPQPVRVAHGVLMLIGCLLLVRALAAASKPDTRTATAAGTPREARSDWKLPGAQPGYPAGPSGHLLLR